MWNDFVLDSEGEVLVKVKVDSNSSLNKQIKNWIYTGEAQIVDDDHVLLTGRWKDNNDLYLGDLQKSAINVLKTVLKLKF